MVEWLKAPVLKTGDMRVSVGSNPTLSAKRKAPQRGAFSFSAWIFAEWDSKGGSWRGAGGTPQPTWLFRRNACDLGRAIHDRPYAGRKETNYQPNRITI